MTPEERNLVTQLFDRLATLEDAQRDREAERLIRDGLQQAPNAPYALVQTVLVQDEALRQADARIRELEAAAGAAERDGSFLGGMRDSVFGRRPARGSVPSVRPGETSEVSPAWQSAGQTGPRAASPTAMGGSFLGTAAAAAAGVIGGSLLLGGIRSAMGAPPAAGAQGAFDPQSGTGGSDWRGAGSEGELSRQAGLDDIGRAPSGSARDDSAGGYGLFDDGAAEEGHGGDDWDGLDGGFDGGNE